MLRKVRKHVAQHLSLGEYILSLVEKTRIQNNHFYRLTYFVQDMTQRQCVEKGQHLKANWAANR